MSSCFLSDKLGRVRVGQIDRERDEMIERE